MPFETERYMNDDGTEFNPNLSPLPDLCVTCVRNEDPASEILCNLTRADQQGEKVFICFAYCPTSPTIDRESVLRTLCFQAGLEYSEDADVTGCNEDEGEVCF